MARFAPRWRAKGTHVSDWQSVDYFSDQTLVEDPYPYFDQLREAGPVLPIPHLGVIAVSGYEEINEVYRDSDTFSSCNSVIGPFVSFPVPLEGDDIGPIIDEHRDSLPMFQHMVTMDPPLHTAERSLIMRLLTPSRLKSSEAFIAQLADELMDEFLAKGSCEFIADFAQPFAMLVVADVLGVPQSDFPIFKQGFGVGSTPGAVGETAENRPELNALSWLDDIFSAYIEDRRATPREDILTELALAKYPDGSTPPVSNVVNSAAFLFAAGQETTARLLAQALRQLAENPETQDQLRERPAGISGFVEETLRLESPVKTDFRLARRTTTIAGVTCPAGTPVMLLNGAANRDPRQFECPNEFRHDREEVRTHVAFGRGVHSCPGGPLARVEGVVTIQRFLARTRNIRLSVEHHGPAGARRFTYAPTWILRGLVDLHLEFDVVEAAK
jgi:cytochrome P450